MSSVLFIPYLASTVWVSTQNFDTGCGRVTAFGEQRIQHGDYNFLRTVRNFAWYVYAGVKARRECLQVCFSLAQKLKQIVILGSAPASTQLLFAPQCSRLSPFLSLGFAWCKDFLMVYVTTTILAAGSRVLINYTAVDKTNEWPSRRYVAIWARCQRHVLITY